MAANAFVPSFNGAGLGSLAAAVPSFPSIPTLPGTARSASKAKETEHKERPKRQAKAAVLHEPVIAAGAGIKLPASVPDLSKFGFNVPVQQAKQTTQTGSMAPDNRTEENNSLKHLVERLQEPRTDGTQKKIQSQLNGREMSMVASAGTAVVLTAGKTTGAAAGKAALLEQEKVALNLKPPRSNGHGIGVSEPMSSQYSIHRFDNRNLAELQSIYENFKIQIQSMVPFDLGPPVTAALMLDASEALSQIQPQIAPQKQKKIDRETSVSSTGIDRQSYMRADTEEETSTIPLIMKQNGENSHNI